MSKKRGAPQKSSSDRKAALTQIRLLASEKAGFEEAAELSGLSLSAWMRTRLRTVAKKELEAFGREPTFLKQQKKPEQ
jgi:hypothetical protein